MTAHCHDCGFNYEHHEFGADITFSNEEWLELFPEGPGGILCARCIAQRAKDLPGVVAIRAKLGRKQDDVERVQV